MKKVSVLIPLYNAEKYIKRTIKSVLSQTYKNIEIIIVDDGSTDNSYSIAKKYESTNIHVYQQKNSGPGAARNKAFSLSCGDYIQYLDADDILDENKLKIQVEILNKNKNALVFGSTYEFHDNVNKEKPMHFTYYKNYESNLEFLTDYWSEGGMISVPTLLIPRAKVMDVGTWNEKWILNEDGDFISRLILKSEKIIYMPESIFYYCRDNTQSLNNTRTLEHYISQYESYACAYRMIKDLKHNEKLIYALAKRYSRLLNYIYGSFPDLTYLINQRLIELGYSRPVPIGSSLSKFLISTIGFENFKFIQLKYRYLKDFVK